MTSPAKQPDIFAGPRSDEYETPGWIFDPLDAQYGFAEDLAATEANAKVPVCYTASRSFLRVGTWWNDVAWCNPPFSLAEEFFYKIAHGALAGSQCVAIYKSANMETAAWKHIFSAATWIAQPHKRVAYNVGGIAPKGGPQFPSAVIGFNVLPPRVPWAHALLKVQLR